MLPNKGNSSLSNYWDGNKGNNSFIHIWVVFALYAFIIANTHRPIRIHLMFEFMAKKFVCYITTYKDLNVFKWLFYFIQHDAHILICLSIGTGEGTHSQMHCYAISVLICQT